MPVTRRSLVILSAAGAIALGTPRLLRTLAPLPERTPLPDVPGFDRIETGAVTLAAPALIGMERAAADLDDEIARVRADPAAALFDTAPPGRVPMAVFTDVNCPNCRQVSAQLVGWIRDGRDDIAVTWHELPLLGPTSLSAARAALAAARQGAYLAVHDRLMRTRFRPSPAFIRTIAKDAGIDPDRMIADMTAPEVDAHLRRAHALAHVFAIPGTPAMIVGRTLVIGALPPAQLRRLIQQSTRN